MKDMSKSSNTIDITDFLTNDNTTEFKLDFSTNALEFDLQNLDEPTSFGGVIHTLSTLAFCTIFNLTTAFDLVPQTQSSEKDKESEKELKFQMRKLQHEYSALLIKCSTIHH